MFETSNQHAMWHRSRATRLIAGIGLTGVLAASVLFPVPARAITTETEAKLTETQKKVEETAAAYDAASRDLDALNQQIAENEASIAEIKAKLPEAQKKASEAMRDLYKYQKSGNSMMDVVFGTQSLDDFITTSKYLDHMQDAKVEALDELNAMQSDLEEQEAELNAAKAKAESEQQQAANALAEAQRLREEAQQKAAAEREAEQELLAQASNDGASVQLPSTGDVNWDVDQATFVAEWAPRIDAYLAGSPLAGQGATFANAAWKYGVDPRFSPAISNTESSKGLHCFRPHNAWGWGNASWGSWEEAIDAHVAGLARGYGYTISVAGAKKYCPPNWYNWYNNTLSEMNRI